jgi:hypothetical protein
VRHGGDLALGVARLPVPTQDLGLAVGEDVGAPAAADQRSRAGQRVRPATKAGATAPSFDTTLKPNDATSTSAWFLSIAFTTA